MSSAYAVRFLQALDDHQRTLLLAAGVRPDTKEEGIDALMSIHSYATDKVKQWAQRFARRSGPASESKKLSKYADYASSLYAKRAWCLHILGKEAKHQLGVPVSIAGVNPWSGKEETFTLLSLLQRQAVYAGSASTDTQGNPVKRGSMLLFQGVQFRLEVPTPLPDVFVDKLPQVAMGYAPEHQSVETARAVEVDGEQEANLIEEMAGDDSAEGSANGSMNAEEGEEGRAGMGDSDLLRKLKGAPVLTMRKNNAQVGIFFVAQVSGTLAFPYAMKTVSLVTTTSKMASPSFGLPAGSEAAGGTCPAGDIGLIGGQAKRRESPERTQEVRDAITRRMILIAKGGRSQKTLLQWHQDIQDLEAGVVIPVPAEGPTKDKLRPAYVCAVCYAMSANYGYANNLCQQAARKKWVQDLLSADKTGGTVALNLAQMVWTYAHNTTHTNRACQEIGVWSMSKKAVVTPSRLHPPVAMTPLRIESLDVLDFPEIEVPVDTQALFQGLKLPDGKPLQDGDVSGFFRLHDSGDFGLGLGYVEAWLRVARLFPGLYFWAPTRQWGILVETSSTPAAIAFSAKMRQYANAPSKPSFVLRDWRRPDRAGVCWKDAPSGEVEAGVIPAAQAPGVAGADAFSTHMGKVFAPSNSKLVQGLRQLAALPNVTIRPSSLYIRRLRSSPIAIPHVEGLSAGSGVAAKIPAPGETSHGEYPTMNDTRGVRAFQCPVYTKMRMKNAEGKVVEKEAKSCRTANCRACWIGKELPIFYGAH